MASIDLKDVLGYPNISKVQEVSSFSIKVTVIQIPSSTICPIHTWLTSLGINILLYLDSWLILTSSVEECRQMIETTLR